MPQPNRIEVVEFTSGFFEALGVVMLLMLPLVTILGIGLVQLLYVIPRALWLRKHRCFNKMKGVITAAVIVFLLNGTCWLLIMHH